MSDTSTPTRAQRLRRDPKRGWWAGVAAGIGRRFEIAPWIVRLAFVFLSFFGGLGLVLYVAGWVLIPADGDTKAQLEKWIRDGDKTNWAGVVLIGIATVVLLSSVRFLDGDVVFAVALLVVGVLLYQGIFDDGPRRSPAPGGAPASGLVDNAELGGEERAESEKPEAEIAPSGSVDAAEEDQEERTLLDAAFGGDAATEPGSANLGGADDPPPAAVDGEAWDAPPPPPRSILGRLIMSALLIVLGAMAIGSNIFNQPIALDQYLAAALAVVGGGLLVGAWLGKARSFILLGIVLVLLVQAATWFDVPLSGGFGDPRHHPTSMEELQPVYRLAAGEMTLDLRDLALTADASVEVSLAAGQLTVYVPGDTSFEIHADAVAGQIELFSFFDSGVGVDVSTSYESPEGGPTLEIDISMGFGEVVLVGQGPSGSLPIPPLPPVGG